MTRPSEPYWLLLAALGDREAWATEQAREIIGGLFEDEDGAVEEFARRIREVMADQDATGVQRGYVLVDPDDYEGFPTSTGWFRALTPDESGIDGLIDEMRTAYAPALIEQSSTPLVLLAGTPDEVTATRFVSRLAVGPAADEQQVVDRYDIYWPLRADRVAYVGATGNTAAATIVVKDLVDRLAAAIAEEIVLTR